MLGTIIGAVAPSIIGGLFGKKDKQTTQTVDYAAMVRDSSAAGFNPLTALRNGGSAGFTTTHHPALSSGEFIGQALGKAFSAFDPHKQKTDELEQDIMSAQLERLQNENNILAKNSVYTPVGASLNVPSSVASRVVSQGPVLQSVTGAPTVREVGQTTVTNPHQHLHVDPKTADAEAFEQRYGGGEIAETMVLLRNGWADAKHNFNKAFPDAGWHNFSGGLSSNQFNRRFNPSKYQ